jgi:hypothetical protein
MAYQQNPRASNFYFGDLCGAALFGAVDRPLANRWMSRQPLAAEQLGRQGSEQHFMHGCDPQIFRLLQGVVDRGEFGVELRADALDGTNDRQGDAGGDQAIFDRGRAGFVAQEFKNQPPHPKLLLLAPAGAEIRAHWLRRC